MSVNRISRTQGEIKRWRQAGNGDLLEGDVEVTIHVGVDISSYALLIGGWSLYPPLCWLSYCTYVQSVYLYKWYIGLPSARSSAVWDESTKVNVRTPSIPAGLKCPPPSNTISLITRLEVN